LCVYPPYVNSRVQGAPVRALRSIFRPAATSRRAEALYGRAVGRARDPGFYAVLGVPDSVDGRFEMISLHVWLLLRRLKAGPGAQGLAQAVFDAMFDDMDRGLREMGAGDLGVGRRIKAMATAFYGRIAAYDRGLAAGGRVLEDTLIRNVWRGAAPEGARPAVLAAYLRRADAHLRDLTPAALLEAEVPCGPAPANVEAQEA
jgi:cytochrome b pre-mRNA-processing protein 3